MPSPLTVPLAIQQTSLVWKAYMEVPPESTEPGKDLATQAMEELTKDDPQVWKAKDLMDKAHRSNDAYRDAAMCLYSLWQH